MLLFFSPLFFSFHFCFLFFTLFVVCAFNFYLISMQWLHFSRDFLLFCVYRSMNIELSEANTQTNLWEIQLSKLPYLHVWRTKWMMLMPHYRFTSIHSRAIWLLNISEHREMWGKERARKRERDQSPNQIKTNFTSMSVCDRSCVLYLHYCTLHYLCVYVRCQNHTLKKKKKEEKKMSEPWCSY